MLDALIQALHDVFSLKTLTVIVCAAVYGLVVGAIPGLTATMAIALMVPFTFFLDPVSGLAAIVTMEACCIFAGDIPGALIRIPGTPSSAAYVDDAYALTKRGRHFEALGTSLIYSVLGGLLGSAVLMIAAPQLARFALQFSSYEYFWLYALGLSCAAIVSPGAKVKGLLSLSIGLLLSCVGLGAAHSLPRLTFGIEKLITGINFIPAMIGLFGISEVLRNMLVPADGTTSTPDSEHPPAHWIRQMSAGTGQRLRQGWGRLISSSGIGAAIGILPGAGADIAAWVSYAVSKRRASESEKAEFGSGSLRGIADATTANNASLAGAWVPALVLGIPGDSVTAIVIGVLLMKNITPGPRIFEDPKQLPLVLAIGITFVLANLLLIPLGALAIRAGSLIVRLPRPVILPLILLFCIVGAYAIDGSTFDVWVMLGMGLLGFGLDRCGVPVGPVVLGIILGGRLEESLVQCLTKSPSLTEFFARPIAAGLGIGCIALWLWPLVRSLSRRRLKPVQT